MIIEGKENSIIPFFVQNIIPLRTGYTRGGGLVVLTPVIFDEELYSHYFRITNKNVNDSKNS